MKLVPLALRLERRPGPLLAQIHDALAAHGQPLRWAITSAQPATETQGAVLLIEAVVRA
ncbi:MAG: hypothetical protein ACO23C_10185 [Prochlorococcaceae cyanobacterium]|jgi:hypothetical protein